jgi:molybdenum cofactor cytidylyltransferase
MMTKTEDPGPKTRDVAAIILAAGRSERMGAFKPLLPFGPKTVIETCIDYLRSSGLETVIVVLGHRAEDLKKHLKNSRVTFALNPDPRSEMSASIGYGLSRLPGTAKAVIIAPVDHPAVPDEVVATLVDQWKKGAQLVVPTWNGRGGHPVLVDLRFRDELFKLNSGRGLKALFDVHQAQVKRVAVSSPHIARDMDTWDDYRSLHQDVFGVPPSEPDSEKPA